MSLGEFVRDVGVGAVCESSDRVLERVAQKLRPGDKKVVELGAGNGPLTRHLLQYLPAFAEYFALETNSECYAKLNGIRDRRLIPLLTDARNVISLEWASPFDLILCSIPSSHLSPPDRYYLPWVAAKLLSSNGRFVFFHQYSRLMIPYLRKYFRRVECEFEPLNFLPCFVMTAEKPICQSRVGS